MKRFFILLTFLSLTISSFAQNQKLGHLNSIEVLTALPDWKAAEQKLETYATQLRKKLTEEEALLQKEYQEYLKRRDVVGDLSPLDIQAEDKKFQDWVTDLGKKRTDAEQSMLKKEKELLNPIREKVNVAIKDFMQEENYAYVFDTAQGNIAIGPLGEDITPRIKAKLGL